MKITPKINRIIQDRTESCPTTGVITWTGKYNHEGTPVITLDGAETDVTPILAQMDIELAGEHRADMESQEGPGDHPDA
jgi:hypothetical protein